MIAVGYLSLVSPALLSFHVSLLTSLAPRVRAGIADVVVGKIRMSSRQRVHILQGSGGSS
jgi:hypothetical protein